MSSLKHKISALMCRISNPSGGGVGREKVRKNQQQQKQLAFLFLGRRPFFHFGSQLSRRPKFLLQGSSFSCALRVCTCVHVCLVSRMRFNDGREKENTRRKRRKTLLPSLFFSRLCVYVHVRAYLSEKREGSWVHLVDANEASSPH